MSRAKGFFRTSFGSALLGGAVVAAFFAIAISAGWIDAKGSPNAVLATPLATPVVSKESGDTNAVNQIYRHDGGGVAFIESTEAPEEAPSPLSPFGEEESRGGGIATGSGIVIDGEGHVLTNNHVVEGATKIEVKLGASDAEHTAEVVGTDPASDIALLKVEAPADQLHPLALGDSSKVRVGDPVVAIGNPFGLDRTVTSGIVSALQRQIQAPNGFSITHVIQTDAAINPGNSGGPLIDSSGEVIGINSQIETGGGSNGNVGIGFAIPIDTAREVIGEIEKNGKVEHAYLGIRGNSIIPALAKAVNLPVEKGVLVAEVVKGGPADKAGLQGGSTEATIEGASFKLGGDIITEVNGKPIGSMEDVIEAVNAAKPGEKMELTILRHGETKKIEVTLGSRPNSVK
ncbi:MAG TPA: trypsin-like peptidase domain-containing protein [Solirubrobacterales bacterium]|jgi:S1-C subfamily serine protease|nr:trypsin-like peptidase domain-containing protein [Solirubrobacterales bacterium]